MPRKQFVGLEKDIEDALIPGSIVRYHEIQEFLDGLESVRAGIGALIEKDKASPAAGLLESFIAGCYEKSEEIDDSSGDFGTFVQGLFCDWIRARQASKADPDKTAERLLSWMMKDDYGYCHDIEKEVAKAFNRAGLAAFERSVMDRLGGHGKGSYEHRRKIDILKTLHVARLDVNAYEALCQQEDGLSPRECEVLAEMCLERRQPENALTWVNRGLTLEKRMGEDGDFADRLPDLRREILLKLGRGGDALASAWEDYRKAPTIYSYEDLMKYAPKAEHAEWHRKALGVLKGADLPSRMEILTRTKEWNRLAEVVKETSRPTLTTLGHHTTEPAAEALTKNHPRLAAKLRFALGFRILDEKQSKHYDAALGHFEEAREILLKEGRAGEWAKVVAEVREKHHRKSGFMPGFERLVQGRTSKNEPTFLERAKMKWERKTNPSCIGS